jgi:ribosomal protein L35
LNYLYIAVFAISAAFTSCDKDKDDDNNGIGNSNDKVYLLVEMSKDDGSSIKFEYDDLNRIKKETYYYDGESNTKHHLAHRTAKQCRQIPREHFVQKKLQNALPNICLHSFASS